MNKPVYVTQPYLPPLEEIIPYLKSTWESKILSNGGPFHEELESKLCEYLGVEHISLCSNGTMALIIGLQALGISGKVITSPFSFVATSHSLLWNGLDPIFVDVDPISLNLDPTKSRSNHIRNNCNHASSLLWETMRRRFDKRNSR